MNRRSVLSAIVVAAALVLTIVAIVRSSSDSISPPSTGTTDSSAAAVPSVVDPPVAAGEGGDDADVEAGPMRRLNVLVYYPAREADGLVGESHEIFMTAAPGDRAKQIIADLISGPTSEGALRALPPGTQIRQIFVLENGTAFVDFSPDLRQGIGGGSTEELLAVYAIVNSVAMNIPEIRRLGILIDGRPIETLNGHMDLRRPLPPNPSLILRSVEATIVRNAGGTGEYLR